MTPAQGRGSSSTRRAAAAQLAREGIPDDVKWGAPEGPDGDQGLPRGDLRVSRAATLAQMLSCWTRQTRFLAVFDWGSRRPAGRPATFWSRSLDADNWPRHSSG